MFCGFMAEFDSKHSLKKDHDVGIIHLKVINLILQVSLGTVTNVDEAVKWLSYTYMFVRMRCNPLAYGLPYDCMANDPNLDNHRRELITIAGMVEMF